MNNIYSTGFKSIRKILIIYGSIFNDTHLVVKDFVKLNNSIYLFDKAEHYITCFLIIKYL